MTLILTVKDQFLRELGKHFEPKLNMNKRIQIVSDLQMFKAKEDKAVLAQLRGTAPEYFTVYLDNEFISSFTAQQTPSQALLSFWKGLKEKYKAGAVRLTPPELRIEQKTEKKDPLKDVKADTKERKMAKEIVARVNKGN